MSDIPGENILKGKKVDTNKKCCFGNCRSDSRYKSYLEMKRSIACDERLYLARSPLESGSSQRKTLRTKF